MTQNKKMNFSTGSGIAQYPWLTKPDYAFDSNGQYKVNLKVPAKDAKDLMDEIKGIAKNEFGRQGVIRTDAVEDRRRDWRNRDHHEVQVQAEDRRQCGSHDP